MHKVPGRLCRIFSRGTRGRWGTFTRTRGLRWVMVGGCSRVRPAPNTRHAVRLVTAARYGRAHTETSKSDSEVPRETRTMTQGGLVEIVSGTLEEVPFRCQRIDGLYKKIYKNEEESRIE